MGAGGAITSILPSCALRSFERVETEERRRLQPGNWVETLQRLDEGWDQAFLAGMKDTLGLAQGISPNQAIESCLLVTCHHRFNRSHCPCGSGH